MSQKYTKKRRIATFWGICFLTIYDFGNFLRIKYLPGIRDQGLGNREQDSGYRDQGTGIRVQGSAIRQQETVNCELSNEH